MRQPIIVIVLALACYTLANVLNGRIEILNIAPMTAAIFAAIGAFGALSIAGK